jgi:hypothetical protein
MANKAGCMTARTVAATDKYIAENIVNGQAGYTYKQAMLDTAYTPLYVSRYGTALSHNPLVMSRIAEAKAIKTVKADFDRIRAYRQIEDLRLRCADAKDRTNEKGCLELICKLFGLLSESINISDNIKREEITAEILLEAKRISHIVLKSKLLPVSPLNLDAKIVGNASETPPDSKTLPKPAAMP